MNTKSIKFIGIITVIALFATVVFGAAAFAQSSDTTSTFQQNVRQFAGRGGPNAERGERPPQIEGLREAVEVSIAETLGITVEELQASHEAGTRLPDLVEELGMDMADVEAAIESTKQTIVNQAVTDGTITAEQAEAILSHRGGPRRGGPGGPGAERGGPRNGGTFNQSSLRFNSGGHQGPGNGNTNAPAFGDSTL